jgi:hypothetical protein
MRALADAGGEAASSACTTGAAPSTTHSSTLVLDARSEWSPTPN